jgi:AcrR family transcriptional regulator
MLVMSTPSPTLTEDTPHKRERRKDARPGELMDAALALFVEKGFAATRVEEVALRAGVSKGTLFLYFPSKVELFKAVVRENITGCFDEWNSTFERFDGSTSDMVRYGMRQWWERVGATPASGITKLVMSEAGQFPEIADFYRQEVIEPGNDLIRRILQRGVARGEFRPLNLDYAIYSIIAPMIFIIMWKHAMGPCCGQGAGEAQALDPLAFVTYQANVLLQGLENPSSTPRTL